MKIKEMPWYNQPWVRVKNDGVSAMNNAELLVAVLGEGFGEENAVDLSNRVLASYNFHKLATLSLPELKREFRKDIHAIRVAAMFEIVRRTNKLAKHGFSKKIETAEDVYNHFVDELKDKKKEHFYALYLDMKNRIIEEELVSVGTLDASLIHAREVFNTAIKASCHSVILVHNHPSGECEPSLADTEATRMLSAAGELLGINVIDHIIIGNNTYLSMKKKGVIS
jgi:DNA repair protein RadC